MQDQEIEDEAKRKRLNQYWKDIAKKKQELKILEQQARMEASTPESKQRGKDMTVIVKKKQKTVLDNEVTNENAACFSWIVITVQSPYRIQLHLELPT